MVMTQYRRRWVCGLLSLLFSTVSAAAEFTARIDRNAVALGEPVTLTLTLINSETRLRAEGVAPNIDLSVLAKDFDVGKPQVAHRYNVDLGRGRSTSELSVELFARRGGSFTLPAFHIDGLSSAPLRIQVSSLAPDALPEVFSRGGVSKSQVWQREHLVAWLDVYHRVPLKSASLGEYIDTEPTRIELLEHRELPQSQREEIVNGAPYQVMRTAWAIFPKESGALKIVLPDVWIVTAADRKLRLPHQPATVQVQALPATVDENLIVGMPQLTQTPPTPAPAVNQFSTWTVTVSGAFSRFALPDNLPLPAVPDPVKLYADRAQRESEVGADGVTTAVRYSFSALPQNAGGIDLPPVRVPYFDTERGVLDVAELAGPRLEIGGDARAAAAPVMAAADRAANEPSSFSTSGLSVDTRGWQIGTAFFALLWLATAALWWRSRAPSKTAAPVKPAQHGAAIKPAHAPHPLQARLLAAFGSASLELGLRNWEQRNGGDTALRATVHAVQRLCYGKDREHTAATPQLQQAVEQAVEIIRRGAAADTAQDDPWRPESFSRRSAS